MKEVKICVIGLGYVGLPLARLFSTKYKTVGFDMNQKRVEALMAGHDATLEVSDEVLAERKAKYVAPEPNIKTGWLSRYARMVTSANLGAVLK